MNEKQLFEALGNLDDELIARSEKKTKAKKINFLKFLIPAACVCLVTATCVGVFLHSSGINTTSDNASSEPMKNPSASATSDTYATLSELLEHLSKNESHDDTLSADGSFNIDASCDLNTNELVKGQRVVATTDGKYSYHFGYDKVMVDNQEHEIAKTFISKIDGENTEKIGSINIASINMFIYEDLLIIAGKPYNYKEEMTEEEYNKNKYGDHFNPELTFSVYDISDPERPVLNYTYTQSGNGTDIWMTDKYLYVVTSDGECACGYSRLEDKSSYYPSSGFGDERELWGESDISILGEPIRVEYSAISVIDVTNGSVAEKEALYGTIGKLYYSNDSVVLSVYSENGYSDELYTFDGKLDFTGKVDIGKIVEGAIQDNSSADEKQYMYIRAIEHTPDSYRIIGECFSDDKNIIFAASIGRNDHNTVTALYNNTGNGSISEILWEDDRAIIVVYKADFTYSSEEKKDQSTFLFAEYTDKEITFFDTDAKGYSIVDRFSAHHGNPFGRFETLISMGDGIYLRYTEGQYAPKGFDIFDFSDSENARKLYESEDLPGEYGGYDYFWYVYDNNAFGVLEVVQSPYMEIYRNTTDLKWTVFKVDESKENPLTETSSTSLEIGIVRNYFSSAEYIGLSIININDTLYYTAENLQVLKVLK